MINKSNVMKIEFGENIGDLFVQKIALFNKALISEEEVRTAIISGAYSDKVVIMTKEQFENVFMTK